MEYYSDYLAHSSRKGSQRKNHKYTARQWVNGRWKYIYGAAKSVVENPKGAAEDAAHNVRKIYNKNITGDEYKGREIAAKENAKYNQWLAENAANEGRNEAANRGLKESERYGRMAAKAEHDYRTKSLKGISESAPEKVKATAEKGRKAIADLFKTKTTVTVTSNLMPAGTKKTIKKK